MAGGSSEGPVARFCTALRQLQQRSGFDRAALARRVGYSRSQLYEILDGRIRRPPEWDRLVEPLVRLCTGDDERAVRTGVGAVPALAACLDHRSHCQRVTQVG